MVFRWIDDTAKRGQHLEQWLSRRSVLLFAVVVAVALGLRIWLVGHLDLRGAPGAGAIQRLSLVSVGNISHWDSRVVSMLLPLADGDTLAAGQLAGLLGGVLAALGALMCGWALGGPMAGLTAGLLAAVWARGVFITVTYGMEGPAWGVAWFGVGLVWVGAVAGRWWGLPLVFLGGATAVLGAAVKGTALPALAFLVMAPFLVRTGKSRGVLVAAILFGTTWFFRERFFSQSVPPLPSGDLEISISAAMQGLKSLAAQPATKPLGWLPELGVLAVVGAALPGRGWWRRMILGGVTALVMGLTVNHLLTGDHLGPMLRMRYLVPPVLGALVLVGCAIAWLVRRWGTLADVVLFRREPARSTPVGWLSLSLHSLSIALVLVPVWFGVLDSMALMRAWAGLRTIHEGARSPTVPVPPKLWTERYTHLGTGAFFNTSAIGGIDLFEMAVSGPDSGVATVPLRDEREGHLTLSATIQRIPSWVVHPQNCCDGGEPTAACAAAVVADIDQGGVLLVLPTLGSDSQGRVDGRLLPWTRWLQAAAESRGELFSTSHWWEGFQGRGSSPPKICGWSTEQRLSGPRRGQLQEEGPTVARP